MEGWMAVDPPALIHCRLEIRSGWRFAGRMYSLSASLHFPDRPLTYRAVRDVTAGARVECYVACGAGANVVCGIGPVQVAVATRERIALALRVV